MLIFGDYDFIDVAILLISDEDVPFLQLGLLVHHNEGGLNRLLEANVGGLEGHFSISPCAANFIYGSLS